MPPSIPTSQLDVTQCKAVREAFQVACLALPAGNRDDVNDKPTVIADMRRTLQSQAAFNRAITDEESLAYYQYALDYQRTALKKKRKRAENLEQEERSRKAAVANLKRSLRTFNTALQTIDASHYDASTIFDIKAVIDNARIAIRRLSKRRSVSKLSISMLDQLASLSSLQSPLRG